MNDSEPRTYEATYHLPDDDVDLPILPEEIPRIGERLMWSSHGRAKGEFTVTDVCRAVDEQHGVLPSVHITLDPPQ